MAGSVHSYLPPSLPASKILSTSLTMPALSTAILLPENERRRYAIVQLSTGGVVGYVGEVGSAQGGKCLLTTFNALVWSSYVELYTTAALEGENPMFISVLFRIQEFTD